MASDQPFMPHLNSPNSEKASEDAAIKERTRLKEAWSVYTHNDLKQRLKEIGSEEDFVEGLIPARSISLLVGDSGLGKSALVYQLAVCVATGMPFLGRKVKQGKVLVMDFENGMGQVDEMLQSIYKHLGIDEKPDNLLLWNLNDAPPKFGQPGRKAIDLIKACKPDFVIIDSLTGMFYDIEDKNSTAIKYLQELRELISKYGITIQALHHIKKPSDDPKYAPIPLEACSSSRQWLLQTRGARALINAVDVRLGVDLPQAANLLISDGKEKEEVALVMKGFVRVRGEIPTVYLSRHCDESGNPLGYGVISQTNLLFNKEQVETLSKLPPAFKFKDARQAYGKADQATKDFLNKCIGLGLIRKIGKREGYEKLK